MAVGIEVPLHIGTRLSQGDILLAGVLPGFLPNIDPSHSRNISPDFSTKLMAFCLHHMHSHLNTSMTVSK